MRQQSTLDRPRPAAGMVIGVCIALTTISSACGDAEGTADAFDLVDERPIIYEAHIGPMLDSNCVRCHSSGNVGDARNGAPSDVNLDTYVSVRAVAERANNMIQKGWMPPDTGGLPRRDRALFSAWLDDGTLEQ